MGDMATFLINDVAAPGALVAIGLIDVDEKWARIMFLVFFS